MKHLFVCGAGRSGTTFLWKILNKSLSVNLATEVQYFSSLFHNGFLHNYKKLKRKKGQVTLDNLVHCLTMGNHFGIYWELCRPFTDQEIRTYFSTRDLTEKNIYKFLMERDLLSRGNHKTDIKYIGEKTPLNIFHTRRLFKWFPYAKILFLYRNPIDVLKSEVNKESKPDYFLAKDNPLYSWGLALFVFFEWLLATLIALYNNYVHKEKFIIVSYKQLSSHQRASLRKICSAIEIDYDDTMCVFKKIGSSYQDGKETAYWYPPKFVTLIYELFLNPLYNLLNGVSLNNKHALVEIRD